MLQTTADQQCLRSVAKLKVLTFNNLGCALKFQNHFAQSLEYFEEAI